MNPPSFEGSGAGEFVLLEPAQSNQPIIKIDESQSVPVKLDSGGEPRLMARISLQCRCSKFNERDVVRVRGTIINSDYCNLQER